MNKKLSFLVVGAFFCITHSAYSDVNVQNCNPFTSRTSLRDALGNLQLADPASESYDERDSLKLEYTRFSGTVEGTLYVRCQASITGKDGKVTTSDFLVKVFGNHGRLNFYIYGAPDVLAGTLFDGSSLEGSVSPNGVAYASRSFEIDAAGDPVRRKQEKQRMFGFVNALGGKFGNELFGALAEAVNLPDNEVSELAPGSSVRDIELGYWINKATRTPNGEKKLIKKINTLQKGWQESLLMTRAFYTAIKKVLFSVDHEPHSFSEPVKKRIIEALSVASASANRPSNEEEMWAVHSKYNSIKSELFLDYFLKEYRKSPYSPEVKRLALEMYGAMGGEDLNDFITVKELTDSHLFAENQKQYFPAIQELRALAREHLVWKEQRPIKNLENVLKGTQILHESMIPGFVEQLQKEFNAPAPGIPSLRMLALKVISGNHRKYLPQQEQNPVANSTTQSQATGAK